MPLVICGRRQSARLRAVIAGKRLFYLIPFLLAQSYVIDGTEEER